MTNYEDIEYKQLKMDGGSVEGKHFTDCTFINCNIFDLSMKNCSFEHCTFRGCTCASLSFKYTSFKNNEFSNCSLIGISWDELEAEGSISLPFLTLENCVLKYNYFIKMRLKNFSFKGDVLDESYFEECSLDRADFRSCSLKNVKFIKDSLKCADFREAKDYHIDLQSNQIRGAKFSFPEALGLLTPLGIIIEGI